MVDALVRELNKLGYQPVFLPRTGVEPPELYNAEGGRLIRRGPLADKLPAAGKLPKSKGNLADIEHLETTAKSIDAATTFLSKALMCLGVPSAPKINLSFTRGMKLSFRFVGITYVGVDPTKLDTVIKDLATNAISEEDVNAGKLHIAYEYAYARTLTMSRSDGRAFEAGISAKLADFFDLGTAASIAIQKGTVISFTGSSTSRAAFAYKAGQLLRTNGVWTFRPETVRLAANRTFESSTGSASTATMIETRKPYLVAKGVVLDALSD